MTQQPLQDSHNLNSLVWEGKYDESGQFCAVEMTDAVIPIQKIYQRLNTTPEAITTFCEKWNIEELALFGSVLRDDFRKDGEDPSDIDFLYLFSEDVNYSLFDVMHMREELENMLDRKVDFVSKKAIQRSRNWLRRQEILGAGMIFYAKRSTIIA